VKQKAYRGIGLEDTSTWWLTWASPTTLLAGYADIGGTRSVDGGVSWSFPKFSPRENSIYHLSVGDSHTLYAASSTVHDLYQSTHLTDARIDGGKGRILFSTDDGATWNTLHDFAHPVIYTATDPANANRLYASVVHSTDGGVFVTDNLAARTRSRWTKLTNPPRTQGHPFNIKLLKDGAVVTTYSARRTAAGFMPSSGVFISADGGRTWDDRTDEAMKYYAKDISIDPNDPSEQTWYVAVRSGWGGTGNGTGGLYKTGDRGRRWSRVFSADSCESATIVAGTGEIYLATLSSGLWYSRGGRAEAKFESVASYPFRQPLRIFVNPNDDREVWVTSFGWGLAVSRTNGAK